MNGTIDACVANPCSSSDMSFKTVAFGDIDGDGDPDMFTQKGASFIYHKNTGSRTNPTFTKQEGTNNPFNGFMSQGLNSLGSSLELADIDNDGDLDMVMGEGLRGTISYYENIGSPDNPNFGENFIHVIANTADIIAGVTTLKDIDGDGGLDMFVGDITGTIHYFENAGANTNPTVFTKRTGADNPMNGLNFNDWSAPQLVDFDNDGDNDLFVGNSPGGDDGFIFYFENTGSSTNPVFTARVGNKNPMNGVTGWDYMRPSTVDLDGDGDYDMFVGHHGSQAIYFETTRRLSSSYEEKTLDANPLSSFDLGIFSAPALKDMDGDSDSDLVVGYTVDSIGYLAYFENAGSISTPIFTQRTGAALNGLTVGTFPAPALEDINNDGDPDMFVGTSDGTIMYFENTGTPTSPTFAARTGTSNPMNSHNSGTAAAPTLKDINGDGDFDMFVGTQAGNILYYENTGTPSNPIFASKTPMSGLAVSGLILSRPVLRDVDGDKDFDMFVGYHNGIIHYFENTGTSTSPSFTQRLGENNPMNSYGKLVTETIASPTIDPETGVIMVVGYNDKLRWFALDACQKAPTCNGRGKCSFSSRTRTPTCECYGDWVGAHCENCPPGKVEPAYESGSRMELIAPPACSPCSSGFWSNHSGRVKNVNSCTACRPGFYGVKDRATNASEGCAACPIGWIQDDEGTSFCQSCNAGTYQIYDSKGKPTCEACGAGRFQRSPGNTTCEVCPNGWGNGEAGASSCNSVPPGSFTVLGQQSKCQRGSTCQGANEPPRQCPTGTYTNSTGSVSCIPCSPGKFAYATGNVKCTNCPSGYLQDKPAQAECVQVEPGQVVADGGSTSISVPLGSKICSVDPPCECDKCASFEACKEGTKGENPPSRQCITCEAGKSSSKAATSCVACDKGKFSADGGGPCEECLAGYFQDQNTNPSKSCEECPAGWSQSNQGQSLCISLNWKTADQCKNDEYLNNTSGTPSEWECSACPVGGYCRGKVTRSSIRAQFGWARCPALIVSSSGDQPSLNFTRCKTPSSCMGAPNILLKSMLGEAAMEDNNESCAVGHQIHSSTNIRCSSCAVNYAPVGVGASGKCVKCTGGGRSFAFIVVAFIFAIVFFVILIALKMRSLGKKKAEHSTMKRTLLTHMQMLSIVLSLAVPWPAAVRSVLAFITSLTNVSAHASSVQCTSVGITLTTSSIFYGTTLVSVLVPPALAILTFVYWFLCVPRCGALACGRKLKNSSICLKTNPFASHRENGDAGNGGGDGGGGGANNDEAHEARLQPQTTTTVVEHSTRDGWIVTNVLLVYILQPSIIKSCFQVLQREEICGVEYWALDDTVKFDHPDHQTMIGFVAAPALLLYGVVLPVLVMTYIGLHGDRQSNRKLMFRFGLLFTGFAPKFWFYELILYARKVLVILIVTFASSNQQQLHIALGVLIVLLYLLEHIRPYSAKDSTMPEKLISNQLHRMESFSLLILIAMIWSAVFFVLGCDDDSGVCSILGVGVLAMNVIFAIVCGWTFAKAFEKKNHISTRLNNMVHMLGRASAHGHDEQSAAPSGSAALGASGVSGRSSEMKLDGVSGESEVVYFRTIKSDDSLVDRIQTNPVSSGESSSTVIEMMTMSSKGTKKKRKRKGKEKGEEEEEEEENYIELHTDPHSGKNYKCNKLTGEVWWCEE